MARECIPQCKHADGCCQPAASASVDSFAQTELYIQAAGGCSTSEGFIAPLAFGYGPLQKLARYSQGNPRLKFNQNTEFPQYTQRPTQIPTK